MFYTPKFCCNCGEKIERASRSFTDSGRFCDVCKHDFVFQRALPVVFTGLMAIVGIFGLGSYWRSGEKPPNISNRQIAANVSNTGKNPAANSSQVSVNSDVQQSAVNNNTPKNASNTASPPGLTAKPQVPKNETVTVSDADAVYFCGAETKKGTPCSRRVKGGGRCWQHKGQAAMLPPEKLLVSQ
jgi:hypothetical protein